ncbi:glycosyltransferase family 2 protein [Parvicella tangerina]|uniref:PGL/p-HBAD biosynthesis glycosyltransferase n=1 Tax=Parvicella tangerina TaxID=2829795 RepID=A0A916JN04_9FLAO|nr:glycosyltransferase family 2 protein [Parvicella tangerina]CAG5083845.1 PGL/p-HBAD biosynthesis glycosyltransferase [Parvicella tangerina]
MKVSIITIAYNSAETIEDTIKSVVSQDYSDIEYIIIDGGSTDATLEIIDRYKDKISTVVSEPDQGIYDAMNKGVDSATGDLIGILNSDDIYADEKVITDIVKTIGDKEAIYADLVYVDREATDKVTRYWKSGEYKKGAFVKGWMPPHPTFFVRKACYDKYGTYDLRLKSAADYECMLRMIHKHEITLAYLPRVITKMRVGGQSNVTVNNRVKANQEDRLAWELNGLEPKFYTLYLKPLRKVGQFLKKG